MREFWQKLPYSNQRSLSHPNKEDKMKEEEMMFKLIYEDKHPDIGQTVELDGVYTLEQALSKRNLLKQRNNWYGPGVRVKIERIT
tara:strand:+ start:117 stop:371 length:255 start_codon:yes stop_codon:yes gene_type:complete